MLTMWLGPKPPRLSPEAAGSRKDRQQAMQRREDDAEDPETPKPERSRAAGFLRLGLSMFMLEGF